MNPDETIKPSTTPSTDTHVPAMAGNHPPPVVTVGMPVYNGEAYIREAIKSIQDQTLGDWRLVVCDNVSTDQTREVVQSLAADDFRIRLVANHENLGAPRNFNRAYDESEPSEFFLWLCADDALAPEFLVKMITLLRDDPGAVGAFSSAAIIDQDSQPTGKNASEVSCSRLARSSSIARYRGSLYCLPALPLFGIYRRRVMDKTAKHGLSTGGDRVFIGEMALQGRILHHRQPLFFRRVHPDQYSGGHHSKEEKKMWFSSLDEGMFREASLLQRLTAHLDVVKRAPVSIGTKAAAALATVIEVPVMLANMAARRLIRDRLAASGS